MSTGSFSQPQGTVTFLFTDIEGSTLLWEQYPTAMSAALQRHDALLRGVIEEWGGYVFKTVGDAFCAAFATAPQALNAALQAQQRLQAEAWGETPLRVRMALHSGVAEARDNDYFGPTLNRTARLLSAGHGGQVLLSRAAAGLVRDALPEGAGLRDLGERRLKDLTQPEHIYQLEMPGLPAAFQPLKTLDAYRHNLPLQITSFVGREREIAELRTMLRPDAGQGTKRLVTLTGPGGSGKTRLSLQVGAELLDLFPGGTWLIELAPLNQPELVAQAAASAMGLVLPGDRLPEQALAEALGERRALLILDNCEHLVAACAALADRLLRLCPQVQLLASSREALGVPGEVTYYVPTLPAPDPRHLPGLEQLTQYEAVRLFIERAAAARPGFQVDNRSAPAVAEICARLDGIPLAIELAAARTRLLTPEQIAARLDDRLRLLTGGSRTLLPRQQTLRALIDWSHDLLSPAEQRLFRRLAVFSGSWGLEDLEPVCLDESDVDDPLDLLASLVNKSLVIPAEQHGEMRYHMLETIREYAWEKCGLAGGSTRPDEQTSLRERHLGHMLELAETAEVHLFHRAQEDQYLTWLNRLHAQEDNLRQALNWALQDAGGPRQRIEAGLRLYGAVWLYWFTRSFLGEGRRWGEQALRLAERVSASDAILGRILTGATGFAYFHGDLTTSRVLAEQALAAGQRAFDPYVIALAHHHLGLTESALHTQAVEPPEHFQLGLEIARQAGETAAMGIILNDLGIWYADRGRWQEASQCNRQDLERSLRQGDLFGQGYSQCSLAFALLELDQVEAARPVIENGALVSQQIGDLRLQSSFLDLQARLLQVDRRFGEARQLYRQAVEMVRNVGDRDALLETLECCAQNEALAGSPADVSLAVHLLAACRNLRQRLGLPAGALTEARNAALLERLAVELGPVEFAAAQAGGEALSLEGAVEAALSSE